MNPRRVVVVVVVVAAVSVGSGRRRQRRLVGLAIHHFLFCVGSAQRPETTRKSRRRIEAVSAALGVDDDGDILTINRNAKDQAGISC
jgi:hypothetical protein